MKSRIVFIVFMLMLSVVSLAVSEDADTVVYPMRDIQTEWFKVGGLHHYEAIDEEWPDDLSSYIYAYTVGHTDEFDLENLTLGNNIIINSLTLRYKFVLYGTSMSYSGNISFGFNISGTEYEAYSGTHMGGWMVPTWKNLSSVWATSPATGNPWTLEELNDVYIYTRINALSGGSGFRVTWYNAVVNTSDDAIIFGQLDGDTIYNEYPLNNSNQPIQSDGYMTNVSLDYSGFNATLLTNLYEYHNHSDDRNESTWYSGAESYSQWLAQSFTIGTLGPNEEFTITNVSLKFTRVGDAGPVDIILTDELEDNNESRYDNPLSYGTIDSTDITTDNNGSWYDINMSGTVLLPDTTYYLVVRTLNSDESNFVGWRLHDVWFSDGYTGGELALYAPPSSSWVLVSPPLYKDFMFAIYGANGTYNTYLNVNFSWFNITSGTWEIYEGYSATRNVTLFGFNSNFSGSSTNRWRVEAEAPLTGATENAYYLFYTGDYFESDLYNVLLSSGGFFSTGNQIDLEAGVVIFLLWAFLVYALLIISRTYIAISLILGCAQLILVGYAFINGYFSEVIEMWLIVGFGFMIFGFYKTFKGIER